MGVKTWTKAAAFAHFGAHCANDRWGWSGVSDDGGVVVLTLWTDIMKPSRPGYTYSDFGLREEEWQSKPGNSARRKHIQFALDRLGGRFRPIYAQPVDKASRPRVIRSCAPKDVWWQITDFDPETGEFAAVTVPE